jgi:hypothetical protein
MTTLINDTVTLSRALTNPREESDSRADAPASRYTANIDQVRFWVGAGLTAAVTALVGLIGMVVAHGILHVPVLLGSANGLAPVPALGYAAVLVALTLTAAGLYDGMLHVAPRATAYYSALISLLTTLAVLLPFTDSAALESKIAFAVMNLGAGICLLILIPMATVRLGRRDR